MIIQWKCKPRNDFFRIIALSFLGGFLFLFLALKSIVIKCPYLCQDVYNQLICSVCCFRGRYMKEVERI